jgi:hypothetical protein
MDDFGTYYFTRNIMSKSQSTQRQEEEILGNLHDWHSQTKAGDN